MAVAQLIDLSNYDTLLVQSTQGRSGTPNGNIFFDVTNGRIELITAQELAQVDLGSGLENNPLDNVFGIKFEALYAFENQERRTDETLRQYDRYFKGTFKFGGAYELINSRKFDDANGSATSSTTDDRKKVRGSGWIERNPANAIGRIYYGNVSLGIIEATSQPYYQLSDGGAPVNYSKVGPIDEAIQVYGDAGVDANTTTFDTRTFLALKVRTFGYNYDEKRLADSGVSQMDGYSSGFALGESIHLTTGSYTLANVYTTPIAPWTSMSLVKNNGADTGAISIDANVAGTFTRSVGSFITDGFVPGQNITVSGYVAGGNNTTFVIDTVTATVITVTNPTGMVTEAGTGNEQITGTTVTVTGFNEADGNFTWTLVNSASGDLNQCVAFLDALAQTDDDIDSGAVTVTNGKRVGTWYSYDAQGRIVTDSPFASEGLFIQNIPTADEQKVVFTDDAGNTKTRPFSVSVVAEVGATAVADVLAWYHSFYQTGYNTGGAVTVQDSTPVDVKGNVSTDAVGTEIQFAYDYDGNTQDAGAGNPKNCVFVCEGDGGATQAKTLFTITRITTVSFSCAPGQENNV